MTKRVAGGFFGILFFIIYIWMTVRAVYAAPVPQEETTNYKVGFYAFDCYHMQDADGKRYGYGYEMMQNIAKYMQSTFSYVGYEKTAKECEELLRAGKIDIYTAAKATLERQEEFAISVHPAITATTCMSVKVGNQTVVAGDYTTYEGLRVGLLRRHSYNETFENFAREKGFSCEIVYYETPTELTNALIYDEVDALVNSYIRKPEDERIVENFGETPYYIMARKEDQALIDELDAAIDRMNVEMSDWRGELYDKYYGAQSLNLTYTAQEKALLRELQEAHTVIKAVANPDAAPYAWYEGGEAYGIAPELFKATAKELGLSYEIVPVTTRAAYEQVLLDGAADIWMDVHCPYEEFCEAQYKVTEPYLTTTVSLLHLRGAAGQYERIAMVEDHLSMRGILAAAWPDAELVVLDSLEQCTKELLRGRVDGAALMTYTAQKLARENVENQLSVDIIPNAQLELCMGVCAADNYHFYGLWEKTLKLVAERIGSETLQAHIQAAEDVTLLSYLYDHPTYLMLLVAAVCLLLLFALLYVQAVQSRRRQKQISDELAAALARAEEANEAKQNFFSKMSHDIRTPLNVVLGMTQIAQKYKQDTVRLDRALNSIATEGNYLLVLINSILDVNQLEHGHVELLRTPFRPATCLKSSVEILRPLAEKKDQQLSVWCDCESHIAAGDANRFCQIMINIISNAIKYTDLGGKIDVRMEALPENWYRFTCADNGIGMSEEFVQHIFEDYVRAEDSRVSKTQGTGLGMSVVKGFTDLMGGRLHIESKLGTGSVFTVELPFEEATADEKEVLRSAQEDENETVQFVGRKVLLVEDNLLNAEIATELLQTIGLSVDWAENGQKGVDVFEHSAPGEYFAVFMDMQMPVMDGIEATKQIRHSVREDCDIPIFAMTANTFASDRKKCAEAGMNGYISKPVDVKAIRDTLKHGTAAKARSQSEG